MKFGKLMKNKQAKRTADDTSERYSGDSSNNQRRASGINFLLRLRKTF